MSHDKRPLFNEDMDAILLENGFKRVCEYELSSHWTKPWERYNMTLSKHGYGYYIVLKSHESGLNPKMNMGSSNDAGEIIALRDMLAKLA